VGAGGGDSGHQFRSPPPDVTLQTKQFCVCVFIPVHVCVRIRVCVHVCVHKFMYEFNEEFVCKFVYEFGTRSCTNVCTIMCTNKWLADNIFLMMELLQNRWEGEGFGHGKCDWI
jgi:hypothetical protein